MSNYILIMEGKYKNFCKNILDDIRCNKPLQQIRTDWTEIHKQCLFQNAACNQKDSKNRYLHSPCFWALGCKDYETNATSVFTVSKMSVEISMQVGKDTIAKYIRSGISTFGIDLFYGSVQQNLDVLIRLQEAILEESKNLGFSIPISIYLKLSPRLTYSGGMKKNKSHFKLRLNSTVILTTNREYASISCRRIIYINAKFLIVDLIKCDIVSLNEKIYLQISEVYDNHVVCTVIVPGVVTPRMAVKFPKRFHLAQFCVSAEELEDLTFAIGADISVIISHSPGNIADCKQLREICGNLGCENIYLFTRLTLSNLDTSDTSEYIANTYDGFLIDCSNEIWKNKIVKLSRKVQTFTKKCYYKRKPIFMFGLWSMYVDPSDYPYAFYYPDKYVIPCGTEFGVLSLHLLEAVFNTLAPSMLWDTNFNGKAQTGSNTIARSIAAASFDFQADAIIICTTGGAMAMKVAHCRPIAPIIAVTNIQSVVNYTSLHHNIWTLLFDKNKDTDVSLMNETHQKLIYGVRFALLKKIINYYSTIILVYRQQLTYGVTKKFVVVKFDTSYVETIRKAILYK